jgi:KUP system potassium uptake protein
MCSGEVSRVSYYIGRETLVPSTRVTGMSVWREAVYAFLQRNAERPATYFCIPTAQVIEIGIEMEI